MQSTTRPGTRGEAVKEADSNRQSRDVGWLGRESVLGPASGSGAIRRVAVRGDSHAGSNAAKDSCSGRFQWQKGPHMKRLSGITIGWLVMFAVAIVVTVAEPALAVVRYVKADAAGANNDENRRHVVTDSGTDATALLDGITITSGNADRDSSRAGGDIYNNSGNPTLTKCALGGNPAAYVGGGIYNEGLNNPMLINCALDGHTGPACFVGVSPPETKALTGSQDMTAKLRDGDGGAGFDGDVDLTDFLSFQAFFNGPSRPARYSSRGSLICRRERYLLSVVRTGDFPERRRRPPCPALTNVAIPETRSSR